MHADTIAMFEDASDVTVDEILEFEDASEYMIETKQVERLSVAGVIQAVDNIGYYVTKVSIATCFIDPDITSTTAMEDPTIQKQLDQLDEIMMAVAFASGVHPSVLDIMIGERCDHWTQKFCDHFDRDVDL